MSLGIDRIEIAGLPPELLQALDERAQQIGTSREDYVHNLIQKDLTALLSLRELYAQVREQIAESGRNGKAKRRSEPRIVDQLLS